MYKQLLATTIIELLSNSWYSSKVARSRWEVSKWINTGVTSEMQNNSKNSMHTNRYRCIPLPFHRNLLFLFLSFFFFSCTFLSSRVHTGRVNGFQISNISDRRQSRPAGVRCTRTVSLLACCRKSRYRLWAFRIAVTQATIHAWFLITWCAQDIPMARKILVRWALARCSI